MAKHIEKNTRNGSKNTPEARRRNADRSAAEGRAVWSRAIQAAQENDESQQVSDDAEAVLDEIDEVLEDNASSESAPVNSGRRRFSRSTAETVETNIDAVLAAELGELVLSATENEDQSQAA